MDIEVDAPALEEMQVDEGKPFLDSSVSLF